MDKDKAIELLKQALTEIPRLRELHFDNQQYKLWRSKIRVILEDTFGSNSREYEVFSRSGSQAHIRTPLMPDSIHQDDYIANLTSHETALKSIIQKYEILGIEEKPAVIAERPKVFIAHGGESPSLNKLREFLEALGVEPLVVEEQPSEGRSVGENVDWYARQADCAIILATKGDIDGKTGRFIPRGNVLIEIGKSQELFKDRIVYLLQAGTKFPTNISEKVWGRFTTQRMDDAFIKIARELKKFGILRAVKPKRRGVDV